MNASQPSIQALVRDNALQMSSTAKTRRGLLLAQMQTSFINQSIASMVAIKNMAHRALPEATSVGVQAALDVFYRAIESKLGELKIAMDEAEEAWQDLAQARRQAMSLPDALSFGHDPKEERAKTAGIRRFALGERRDRLKELTERTITQSELLQTFLEKTEAYMEAQTRTTQLRADVADLLNGATHFLTEQIGNAMMAFGGPDKAASEKPETEKLLAPRKPARGRADNTEDKPSAKAA
jgi:hypothetical protein